MIYLNGEKLNVEYFADNAPLFTVERQPRVNIIEWHYESEAELSQIWFLTNHLRRGVTNATKINLLIPYLVTSRFDRVKEEHDVFFLKYFADFLNILHFDSVTTFDVHSYVSEALIENLIVLSPKALINKVLEIMWREYQIQSPLVYMTDLGSVKRCSELISVPFLYGAKQRDWNTRKITGLQIEKSNVTIEIEGRDILLIDDIISSGTTLLKGAEGLKSLGANRLFVYASHCENQIYDTELYKSTLIDKIYTTNSILVPRINDDKIKILDYKLAQPYSGHSYR